MHTNLREEIQRQTDKIKTLELLVTGIQDDIKHIKTELIQLNQLKIKDVRLKTDLLSRGLL